jgi:uncharacterized membrane protein
MGEFSLLAEIVLGARGWIVPALVLAALALAAMTWSYFAARSPGWLRAVGLMLKAAGVVLIAVCLIEPLSTSTRPRPGSNLFLIVADNSRSLQLADRHNRRTRGEVLQAALQEDSAWLTRLAQDYDVRRYTFAAGLEPVQNFNQLALDGEASALALALGSLRERFAGQPVAGILLLTDGNATDLDTHAVAWKDLPPVYPVALASESVAVDVAVSHVAVSQTNFDAAPVTITAEVAAQSLGDQPLVVRVLDDAGHEVERRTLAAAERQASAQRFLLRPEHPGVSFYQVQAALAGEEELKSGAHRSAEATLSNNRRYAVVDRGGGPYRVLYVGGLPNWEFKFLRRAVEADDEVQLVALVRIAKREPKFTFQSRTGERTNPLFRGFNNTGEETEEYNQPVLVRLGTEDQSELRGGFPKDAEDLFRYHAVVLDDVEASFFTQDQLSLLQRFVSQRGGGLLMMGGKNSFQEGSFARTAVGEMLPVYLDRSPPLAGEPSYRLKLTREGWLQPWVRVRASEDEETQRLAAMPPFHSLNRIDAIKPGASVLAEVESADGAARPALAVQPFGRGRVAALLIGDLWRWHLRREDPQQSDLEKSWRQTVRWLVADVPQRVEVETRRAAGPGLAPQELIVRARDKEFAPLDNATVKITIRTPDQREIEIAADSSERAAGEYRAAFAPRIAGPYRARVAVTAADGSDVGQRETGWAVEPETEEFRKLDGNRPLLEQIARDSGGEVISVSGLSHFVSTLPQRKIPVTETWTYPLWHHWGILSLAMLCLVGEWGLRRWKGLP